MDPLNNNPASNAPAPAAPATPGAPAVNPDVANAALNPPVNPVVTPTTPAAPTAPVTPAPATPAAPALGAPAQMSMSQMFQPQPAANQGGVFDETTAISVPEGPKPVDPVEEELKAPLKAAGPVPGSIGSAVSMPPQEGSTSNLALENVATQGGENPMTANAAPAVKKNSFLDKIMTKTKMSKTTLILLAAVCGVITILLIVVLVMLASGQL